MHIKKQIEQDGQNYHGFSSTGKDSAQNETELKAATQVVVLMVVALDDSWKVPVTYFLHKGSTAEDKVYLVLETLKRLFEIGKKNHNKIFLSMKLKNLFDIFFYRYRNSINYF